MKAQRRAHSVERRFRTVVLECLSQFILFLWGRWLHCRPSIPPLPANPAPPGIENRFIKLVQAPALPPFPATMISPSRPPPESPPYHPVARSPPPPSPAAVLPRKCRKKGRKKPCALLEALEPGEFVTTRETLDRAAITLAKHIVANATTPPPPNPAPPRLPPPRHPPPHYPDFPAVMAPPPLPAHPAPPAFTTNCVVRRRVGLEVFEHPRDAGCGGEAEPR